jgi:hypothetical protein
MSYWKKTKINKGKTMDQVVGFMSSDGHLGRTFLCSGDVEVQAALKELFDEQGAPAPPLEYWDDHCSFERHGDIYFVGGLETVEI